MIRTVEIRGQEFRFADVTEHTAYVFDQLDEWESDTFDAIDKYLHGGTFVDVGAWIGIFCVYAASRAKRIVALEPDPVALGMLRLNLSLNDVTNVEVIQRALWSFDGPVSLFQQIELGDSMTGPTRQGQELCATGMSVETLRASCGTPDLVKVDTEGSEGEFAGELVDWGVPLHLSIHANVLTQPLPEWSREPLPHPQPRSPYYALVFE